MNTQNSTQKLQLRLQSAQLQQHNCVTGVSQIINTPLCNLYLCPIEASFSHHDRDGGKKKSHEAPVKFVWSDDDDFQFISFTDAAGQIKTHP